MTTIKSEPTPDNIHLVLRMPRIFKGQDKEVDIIRAYNTVIKKDGQVAIAKYGVSLAISRYELLCQGIAGGYQNRLYLALGTKNRDELKVYSAPINSICLGSRKGPPAPVPDFYHEINKRPAFWCVLTEQLKMTSINNLQLITTGGPLKDALLESHTVMMVVRKSR